MVFPYDLGEKIFIEYDNGWQSVANTIEYDNLNDIILTKFNGDDPTTLAVAKPDLSNVTINAPTNFKVVLSGRLCDNKEFIVEKTIPFTVVP